VHNNTLKSITELKTNKYAPRIRRLSNQMKDKNLRKKTFEVEFVSFIISSLGALPNKSINSLTKIIGTATKNAIVLWCKKLVVKALKGSFMICVKAKPDTLANNNKKRQEISSDEENEEEEERNTAEEIIE
jgi:dsDNA-specific endonuclease/ATPase MutS2